MRMLLKGEKSVEVSNSCSQLRDTARVSPFCIIFYIL